MPKRSDKVPEAAGQIIRIHREESYGLRREPVPGGGSNVDKRNLLEQRKRFPEILFGRVTSSVKRLVVFEDVFTNQRYDDPVMRLPSDYLRAFSDNIGQQDDNGGLMDYLSRD